MISLLIIGLVALLLVSALLAPLESLGWWAGWFGEEVSPEEGTEALFARASAEPVPPEADHYIVYLSGIGAFTGSSIPMEEPPFLAALEKRLPGTVVIDDVFPYSVTNMGLTGERSFSWIWRKIEAMRPKNPNAYWLWLVVIRNLFQVAVSADDRYGPIYNLGLAKEIWRSLLRHGYRPGSGTPVTLMGTSGGGQTEVGAVTYLAPAVGTPIKVISLGGVISADPGLLAMDHLYHLYGSKDGTQALGYKVFPGRWPKSVWPFAAASPWYQAEAAGKITLREIGPFVHTGKGSPFDATSHLPDGESHLEHTLAIVVELISGFYRVKGAEADGQAGNGSAPD